MSLPYGENRIIGLALLKLYHNVTDTWRTDSQAYTYYHA